MVNNHISRLLRLARRTGDRIIVTDEQGREEPLVILPLDEYESLIDGAFGPEDSRRMEKSTLFEVPTEEFSEPWTPQDQEDELEDIQIEDTLVSAGDDEDELASGEADIDEEALKSLWTPVEKLEKSENIKESMPKMPSKTSQGEEEFYLERLD